ncbi:MAG: hypothetical protein ACR2J7_10530 [Luteimonas sp.]
MRTESVPGRAWPWLALALVFVAQLPLVLNPGYFSHDELQWAVHAEAGRWVSWTDADTFQYRPLTFNLWQWLSRHAFATPQAFHAVVVALGAANAALAAALLRRLGVPGPAALAGALAFALGPYAAYVHGWVGTLGDLLWVGCALGCGLAVTSGLRLPVAAALVVVLTVTALLAKEAAVVIPLLLALGAWLLGRDRRRWGIAAAVAAVPVAAYLAFRAGALLDAPRTGSQYAINVAHAPLRWFEYQAYPFNPPVFEVHSARSRGGMGPRTLVSAALWMTLVAALVRAGWRWAAAFVIGGGIALAPVLVLASASNQYAYGFAVVTAGVVAGAWPHAPRWGRIVMVTCLLLLVWHGVNVMRQVRMVGERQAVFSPAVANALSARPHGPLRLRVLDPEQDWIYQRFTHAIPSYRGVAMGDRVQVVADDGDADLGVRADGALVALPADGR